MASPREPIERCGKIQRFRSLPIRYRRRTAPVNVKLRTSHSQTSSRSVLSKNKVTFNLHSHRFLELLLDVDALLRTRPEYSFDKWLTDARKWGDTPEEKDLLEKDATALVTIWGADQDPLIFDYSWREWSGLIEGYYLKRWEKFYAMLEDCLATGKEYSEEGLPLTHGRQAFRANDFYCTLGDWELNYVSTPGKARQPIILGNEIDMATKMFQKYSSLAEIYYKESEDISYTSTKTNIFENLGE